MQLFPLFVATYQLQTYVYHRILARPFRLSCAGDMTKCCEFLNLPKFENVHVLSEVVTQIDQH